MEPTPGRDEKKFYNMSLEERHAWLQSTQNLDWQTISVLSGEN